MSKVNYFGMSYSEIAHAERQSAPIGPEYPLTFIRLEKPSQSQDGDSLLMIVKAETAHGLQIIPKMFVAEDKKSLTTDKSKAVRLSLGWAYSKTTNWRKVGLLAINLMAEKAKSIGIPNNKIDKWFE